MELDFKQQITECVDGVRHINYIRLTDCIGEEPENVTESCKPVTESPIINLVACTPQQQVAILGNCTAGSRTVEYRPKLGISCTPSKAQETTCGLFSYSVTKKVIFLFCL